MKNIEWIELRSRVVTAIRRFFDEGGFLEMHTPRLVGLPGQEPYLDPMWTEVHRADGEVFPAALITSPEYAMKRLLSAGLDRIYDLGPCFRDGEPWDGSHDPEFLMLEWYRREAGLDELMQDTENMMAYVASALHQEHASLRKPFRRLTVKDAMKMYAGIDLDPLMENRSALEKIVGEHGHSVHSQDTWDDLFFKIFLSEVEPHMGWNQDHTEWQPTFLSLYPASMAALARRSSSDPRYALRTELYIGDLELANGFAELADMNEQRERFLDEQRLRQSLGKKIWPLDELFLACLPTMGNAAGIAFGVERFVMLLGGVKSISEILPIPVQDRFSPVTSS